MEEEISEKLEPSKQGGKRMYFIALLPPDGISEIVTSIKQEMAKNYNTQKALRLPPHFTVQVPFWNPQTEAEKIIEVTETFTRRRIPIEIELVNFGSFKPHTIFIKVKDPTLIRAFQEGLAEDLKKNLELSEDEAPLLGKPHLTIAYKDLRPRFKEAWKDYKKRAFYSKFMIDKVVIFEHDQKQWHPLKNLQLSA